MRKLILAAVMLSGCVTEGQMQRRTDQLNAAYERSFQAVRYEYSRDGEVHRLSTVLAGKVGQTALPVEMQQAVFQAIETGCGFSADTFKEFRVVRQGPPVWYEVWVFDPEPQAGGMGKGVSVVLTYDPQKNVTDVGFNGPPSLCSWSQQAGGARAD